MSKRMYLIGWILVWFNVLCVFANLAMIPVDVICHFGSSAIIMNSSCIVINTMWAIVLWLQLRDVTTWERAA